MYQTKFDRWLKETFVYEHHIKVVHLPEKIPSGVKIEEITSLQYHYLLTVKSKAKADKLIEYLRDTGSIFSTRIHERKHWYNPLINSGKHSFTYRVFWWIVIVFAGIYTFKGIRTFTQSDLFFELTEHVNTVLRK